MSGESEIEPDIGAEYHSRPVDLRIAELAERQHGVVARGQLLATGVSRRVIGHRVAQGRLLPVHRGVYAVGHRGGSQEARWMAAVLASGQCAVLSHRSAASLWRIRATTRSLIEVTASRQRSRPGIETHRGSLPGDEMTVLRGIPVTTVPRTLLDLAAVLTRRDVERAVEEAEVLQLADALSVADLVERHPGRRGVATIRAILATQRVGSTITRSELEERFLVLLDQAGLPRPDVNRSIHVSGRWIEGDCVWLPQRMIAELDGHAFHTTAAAFERDRCRDRALQAAGWRVVRITWRQLHDDSAAVVADLRGLLGADVYPS
jgi:very-short-patch-repair endonuclease/predicted transcriptional regulator of viral defense system